MTLKNIKLIVRAYCDLKMSFFHKKHNIINIKCLIAMQLKKHRHVHSTITENDRFIFKRKKAEFLSVLVFLLLL